MWFVQEGNSDSHPIVTRSPKFVKRTSRWLRNIIQTRILMEGLVVISEVGAVNISLSRAYLSKSIKRMNSYALNQLVR